MTVVDWRRPQSHDVAQRSRHDRLLRTASAVATGRSTIDAIVVPASRPARHLDFALHLAAANGCLLVVLCSRSATVAEIEDHAARVPGSRVLLVPVPEGYALPDLSLATGAETFHRAGAGRESDLSVKRNVGLLLGRMLGWTRLVYLDDDIYRVSAAMLNRLGGALNRHPVAGFASTEFPDNSVVCHASRLSGRDQGIFVSGSALGVDCSAPSLPFFPDVYNEDWFFFYEHVRERTISYAGQSQQLVYDPYLDPQRAAREEFGDVLAEGLYALAEEGRGLHHADHGYWASFLGARSKFLNDITNRLWVEGAPSSYRPLASLQAAGTQLEILTPELCVSFLASWQQDRHTWDEYLRRLPRLWRLEDALDHLGLQDVVGRGL